MFHPVHPATLKAEKMIKTESVFVGFIMKIIGRPTRKLTLASSYDILKRVLGNALLILSLFLCISAGSERSHMTSLVPNRLSLEKSPYLLQHAANPVDWYPWGPEAFEKAQKENKLIFLSIGYSTCHWCHVMERESFENQEIAGLLNKDFVAIKVDREERPDIDQIYMTAVQAMTGSGGWPLTVFLTPEGNPVTGGTYFPSEDRWGRPGMRTDRKSTRLNSSH